MTTTVLASAQGAALDADLLRGGGTDDTAVLQGVLDRARDGAPLHLVVDGPALVSGLDVHSNTTIEFAVGAGLYLQDGSRRAVLRNASGSRDEILNEHIVVRGGFFNGNCDGQVSSWGPEGQFNNRDEYGAYQRTIEFFGVRDLRIEGCTIWNPRAFSVWIANADYVTIRDVTVDVDFPTYPGDRPIDEVQAFMSVQATNHPNQDGIHFTGPASNVLLERLRLRTFDDAISLCANESTEADATVRDTFGPLLGQGPITDVVIRDVVLDDVHVGIRLLSCDQRFDRILIENVSGSVRHRMAAVSHFGSPDTFGEYGSVVFRNINVDPRPAPPLGVAFGGPAPDPSAPPVVGGGIVEDEMENPTFSINAKIERLVLDGVSLNAVDDRPVLRFGPDSDVGHFRAEVRIKDPRAVAIPIRLRPGARVRKLELDLEWDGQAERLS
jgi:hypothetical protein